MQQRTFSLAAVPPYRLDLTAWALRRREDNAIDSWDGSSYRRVLELGGRPVEVVAAQAAPAVPQIAVQLTGVELNRETEAAAQAALHRLLGLETDLSPFYRLAADDPFLGPLAKRFRGLKPPRLPSLFECLVNAIACQQLTLTVGIRLLNRLAETYGMPVRDGGPRAFPRPAELAGLSSETLRPLGFSRAKALSIVALAAAIETGVFDAERDRVARQRGGGRRAHASPRHRPLERRIRPPARARPTQRLSRRRRRRPKQPRAPAPAKGSARLRRRPSCRPTVAALRGARLLPPAAREPRRSRGAHGTRCLIAGAVLNTPSVTFAEFAASRRSAATREGRYPSCRVPMRGRREVLRRRLGRVPSARMRRR